MMTTLGEVIGAEWQTRPHGSWWMVHPHGERISCPPLHTCRNALAPIKKVTQGCITASEHIH